MEPEHSNPIQISAQFSSPKDALERLFTTDNVQADWFAPEFLAQSPIAQVQQIIAELLSQLGTYQGVKKNGEDYLVIFSNSLPTQISFNAKGQIAKLLFQSPMAKVNSLDEVVAGFRELPGKVSFLVQEGKITRAALNTTTPLAVGSAFKLVVLKALKSQVASFKQTWKDVVPLQSSWKSLPSGILQTWPDGSLLTVETLAALMISQSDNTATDSLINLIGRQYIESLSPRNRPFLTTRELFLLKSPRNRDVLMRYRSSNEAQRRALLGDLSQKPLPDVSEFVDANPVALDVEWFFTAEELCDLIEDVASLPLFTINPGVANAKDWQRVAFKGGSEAGVLNLTTWLKAKNGKQYCVVATWNNSDASLEESKFLALYNGAIAELATDK